MLKKNRRWWLKTIGITTLISALKPAIFGRYSVAQSTFSTEDKGNVYYVALTGKDSNPGTIDNPWATIDKATKILKPGDTVYLRGGIYTISKQIRPENSGVKDQWITYRGYPGEKVIISAQQVPVGPPVGSPPFPHDQGAFQIEEKSYIRIINLEIIDSHNSGFTVRKSHHIELYNNATTNTFAPGIGVWHSHHCKVIGNTVVKANNNEMRLHGSSLKNKRKPGPHEAISMGTTEDFEVAYNHIYFCHKEGIDCKGVCKRGIIHHNYVHNCDRQGIYLDSWKDVLEDITIYENIIHDCHLGLVISTEGGPQVDQVYIHHNLIYNNLGPGIYLSRSFNLNDGLRTNITIANNTIYHNGYGTGACQSPFWLTGGLYIHTTKVENLTIINNIFSENKYFQIGYSSDFDLNDFAIKNISIDYNLIHDLETVTYPVYLEEWAKDYVYAIKGNNFIEENPLFISTKARNLYLKNLSPAINAGKPEKMNTNAQQRGDDLGAFPASEKQTFWWLRNFPPQFDL